MGIRIRYRKNPKKILEGLIWVAQKKPGIDHYHVVKIFFGADKCHLNKYGRPVFGDNYVAMKCGPVPSLTYDMIKRNRRLSPLLLSEIDAALTFVPFEKSLCLTAKRPSDLDYFSGTDLDCLEESFRDNSELSFGRLKELTHREPAYADAWNNKASDSLQSPMNVELLIDSANPGREKLIAYIRETSGGAIF